MSRQELKNIFTTLSPSIPTLIPISRPIPRPSLRLAIRIARSIRTPETLPSNADELGKNGNSKNQINTRKCLVSIACGCL